MTGVLVRTAGHLGLRQSADALSFWAMVWRVVGHRDRQSPSTVCELLFEKHFEHSLEHCLYYVARVVTGSERREYLRGEPFQRIWDLIVEIEKEEYW